MRRFFDYDRYACILILGVFSVIWAMDGFAAARDKSRIHVLNLALQEGLSQNTVTSIVQDARGYIWMGTQDGLNRFDGYRFKVYQPESGNSKSLSNNSIWALYVDRAGVMWVGTYEGLNRYDSKTDSFSSYRHQQSDLKSLSHDDVRVIYEDSFGVLWVGTQGGGLNAFDRKQGVFVSYRHTDADVYSIASDVVSAICEDKQGNLWIGTSAGLSRFDRAKRRFVNDSMAAGNGAHAVLSIYADREQYLWVGTAGDGVRVYLPDHKLFRHYKHVAKSESSLAHDTVMSIFEDSNNTLWLATDGGGLEQWDRRSDVFLHHQHDPMDPYSMSENRIVTLFEDRSGAFWIGMYSRGVSLYNRFSFVSGLDRNQPVDGSLLSHSYVRAFLVDRNNILWVGTEDGGVSATTAQGQTRHYRHDEKNVASLANNRVFSLFEDSSGMLWVGSGDGWLNKLDPKTGRVVRYASQPSAANSIRHGNVRSILEDRSGNFWVASDGGGLHLLDRKLGVFKHFHHDPHDPHSLANDRVFSVFQDRQDMLWVSTFGGGLDRFDPATGKFHHHRNDPGSPSSISHNYIMMAHEDGQERFWVGTYGGGLNLMDRKSNTFTRYGDDIGLPNNAIYGILDDQQGNLWLSHNKGLSRFDPLTRKLKNYDIRDGLQSNEFNGGAYYKDATGKLYFGGLDGFNAFYPADVRDNPYVPQIVITDFQLFNKSMHVGELHDGRVLLDEVIDSQDSIVLSHKDSVFSLEFAALSFVQPLRNQYAYTMEGFEENWNMSGARHFATYTALPAGDYVFRVKASNNHDVWNSQGVALQIHIMPPFWQTWWFRAGIGLLLLLLMFAAYAMRMRSVKARNAMLHQEVKIRTAELEVQKANLERALSELSETRDALVESAHKAGMADTATGVLHNVGNLLNSVNTSVGLIWSLIWKPAAASFYKANELLRENIDTLESFVTTNPKGRKLMQYYLELEKSFRHENELLRENAQRLNDKIAAINEAIAAQQQYAKGYHLSEILPLTKIVEDTLKLQAGSLEKYKIETVTEFAPDVPPIMVQKTKLVQILINLYKNAKESMLVQDEMKRVLSIRVCREGDTVYLKVADTGIGIEKDRLSDIFAYGFSTKASGHGFGLHSSANYMTEMGGKMWAESEGRGQGATFVLSFPVNNESGYGAQDLPPRAAAS